MPSNFAAKDQLTSKTKAGWLYLYSDKRRDIRWNIAKGKGNPEGEAQGISRGLRLYFIVHPNLSETTDILNYSSNLDLPGRSILEELILRIASTAGQYGKILPSRLSNAGELNFNIITFINWECKVNNHSKTAFRLRPTWWLFMMPCQMKQRKKDV